MNRWLRVALGLNLAAIPIIEEGPRHFAHACTKAYAAAVERPVTRDIAGLPWVSLFEVLRDREPTITLRIMPYEDGMLPVDEAKSLVAVAVAEQPSEVLEIGTYMGHTTRLLAENLPNATIHTVDLPIAFSANGSKSALPMDDHHLIAQRVVGREFQGAPCAERIRQHFADTATWDFREAGSPSLFFIDGSHTYEYVKSDSEHCLAVAAEGAVFLWHDCDVDHPGVVRFIKEWRDQGRDIRRIGGTSLAYWKL